MHSPSSRMLARESSRECASFWMPDAGAYLPFNDVPSGHLQESKQPLRDLL
jgi:hypothetical protein